MDAESESLVREAEAAYSGVVRDPARYTASIPKLIIRARAAGDPEALVVALRAQAWARHAVLDNQAAKKTLDQAARIARRAGLGQRLGDVLVTRAVALHELGRRAEARQDLGRAETLVRDERRPEIGMQRALLEHNAGRLRDAAALYQQVLADPRCPPDVWIKAANNLSAAYTDLGRPQAALDVLAPAAARAREHSPLLFAIVTNSQAWSSFHAGDVVASLRLFEQAGRLYADAGLPLGEHYLDYADVLVDLRLLDEALTISRSAAAEFEAHGARLMAAQARLRCAQLALLRGDRATAGADVAVALGEFRRQRRTAWTAQATVVAVEVAAAGGGQPPGAVGRLSRSAGTLQRHGLRAAAVGAHLAAGRAALALAEPRPARQHLRTAAELARGQALLVRLRGRLAQALEASTRPPAGLVLRHCRTGLTDLARHRAALPSMELRVLAAAHGVELGELGLRELLRTAPAGRLLAWMELTRAAALLLVEPPPAEVVREDLAALRAADQELRAARREDDLEPAELAAHRARLEAKIRRASWTGTPDRPATAEVVGGRELRSLLDGRQLAEYAAVGDDLVAVVVGPGRTRLVELGPAEPVHRATDMLLFALRRLLRGGRHAVQARETAEHFRAVLRRALVTPLGVGDDVPLVVVPAGRLHRVPWPGLHPAEISVVPSATFWARSRRAARTAGPARLALVAGPGLPGAVAEVRQIGQARAADLLLPPDSSVQATLTTMAGAGLAHLACHGQLRSDNPLFSSLLLSDGSLTLYEMVNSGVVPRRVVLAACHAGAEHRYAGGEVIGFASALMARGTAGVVAPTIPLPDGASVPLMTRLHGRVAAGATLPQALWAARTDAGQDQPEDYVAWSSVTAYGAA